MPKTKFALLATADRQTIQKKQKKKPPRKSTQVNRFQPPIPAPPLALPGYNPLIFSSCQASDFSSPTPFSSPLIQFYEKVTKKFQYSRFPFPDSPECSCSGGSLAAAALLLWHFYGFSVSVPTLVPPTMAIRSNWLYLYRSLPLTSWNVTKCPLIVGRRGDPVGVAAVCHQVH